MSTARTTASAASEAARALSLRQRLSPEARRARAKLAAQTRWAAYYEKHPKKPNKTQTG